MEDKIYAINAAYDQIVALLYDTRKQYLEDLKENPEDFEGITKADAFIWFMESF